jgi:hypothetical protein
VDLRSESVIERLEEVMAGSPDDFTPPGKELKSIGTVNCREWYKMRGGLDFSLKVARGSAIGTLAGAPDLETIAALRSLR